MALGLKERFWNRLNGKDVDMTPSGSTTTTTYAVATVNFAFGNGADYYVFAEPTAGPALMRPKFFEELWCSRC